LKKNILFLIVDSLPAHKILNKRSAKIPNIESLMNKGTNFSQAISSSDGTEVSWASLFTGLHPFRTGINEIGYNKLPENISNYFKLLSDNDYESFAIIPKIGEYFGITRHFKNKEDLILLKIAKEKNILGFAGNENDVLERFYQTAISFNADPIVRITGDCPLIDHKIIDEIVDYFLSHKFDYISNTLHPTYPDGEDVEVFSFRTLKLARDNSKWKSEREHVTPYIKKNPKKFKIFNYANKSDLSKLRWCLDDKSDLKLIRAIYKKMNSNKIFSINDILKILEKYPFLTKINSDLKRNDSYFTLLKNDTIIK